jgi:hypothetical protein
MRVEWLYSFMEVVRCKSLSKASEHLHISQPGLSKQIRQLESALGVALFDRSTAGVTLTPALPFPSFIDRAVELEVREESGPTSFCPINVSKSYGIQKGLHKHSPDVKDGEHAIEDSSQPFETVYSFTHRPCAVTDHAAATIGAP